MQTSFAQLTLSSNMSRWLSFAGNSICSRPGGSAKWLAYFSYKKSNDLGILYLKQFDVDPKGLYLDHPWEKLFDYGDAIQMYNDDGRFGEFCEIECHGPAKILKSNEKLWHTVMLSVIIGDLERLKEIAADRLEINMGEVKLYYAFYTSAKYKIQPPVLCLALIKIRITRIQV